jgi:ATP-dependent Clp protease adapter protein ClpS
MPVLERDTFTFTNDAPMVKLILHDDSIFPAEVVVEILSSVMGFSNDKSYQIMMDAHRNGRALIGEYTEPFAELSRDQLVAEGLTVSIEK